MKKYVAFLCMICILACALLGCVSDAGSDTENLPELRIGSDEYEPYIYVDDDGNFAGIDAELAEEACRRMGYKPVFVKIRWDEKDKLLESGEIDCVWGSFSMNGREDDYIWAGPYLSGRQVVVVKDDGDIREIADLEGKKVAVQVGSKPEKYFLGHADKSVPSVNLVYSFVDMSEVLAAMKKDYVDACAGHEMVMKKFVRDYPESYRILDETLLTSQLGVAFSKNGDGEIARRLGEVLNDMTEDGFIREVYEKYGSSYEISRQRSTK